MAFTERGSERSDSHVNHNKTSIRRVPVPVVFKRSCRSTPAVSDHQKNGNIGLELPPNDIVTDPLFYVGSARPRQENSPRERSGYLCRAQCATHTRATDLYSCTLNGRWLGPKILQVSSCQTHPSPFSGSRHGYSACSLLWPLAKTRRRSRYRDHVQWCRICVPRSWPGPPNPLCHKASVSSETRSGDKW